jgi:hypothetical protein
MAFLYALSHRDEAAIGQGPQGGRSVAVPAFRGLWRSAR